MTVITNRLLPMVKSRFVNMKKFSREWNWNDIGKVMNAYWLRTILVSCLSPFLIIIPALAFKLASGAGSVTGYILSVILLIPWLLIPALFVQHIASHSKAGKICAYSLAGILFISYILWINIIDFI